VVIFRYIKWTQESYPAGTRSLTELLHKTATTFKDKAQYKNDRRYLQVWILLVRIAKLCVFAGLWLTFQPTFVVRLSQGAS
jgi:hypothetical protein